MSVSPSVVVRGVVVLPEEGVEAPVVGEEGAVAVAEVPLAHQVRPVAALPPQQRGQRGEAAGGRGEVRVECVKTTSPGVSSWRQREDEVPLSPVIGRQDGLVSRLVVSR